MKKLLLLIFTAVLCFSLVACSLSNKAGVTDVGGTYSNGEDVSDTINGSINNNESAASADEYPIIGTWKNTTANAYIRIQESGEILVEMVNVSTSTSTVNGVTTSSSSTSVTTSSAIWEIQGNNFMYNKIAPYNMTVEGGEYKLVGEKTTYIRVGGLDYVIETGEEEKPEAVAQMYTVGDPIVADGIELVLTEQGISDDIRVTSNSSGITITSGPSPEADKQFVYLKGTLKNTSTAAVRAAIGGTLVIDGYEYDVKVDTINENGTPASTIEPLDTVIILIYAHVPTELTGNFAEGELKFGFNNNFENVDITNSDYLYYVSVAK